MPPKRNLRVAMIAPPWLQIPPKGYGGIERLLDDLVQELQHLDVDVTLFGVKSDTSQYSVDAYFQNEQYKFMHRTLKEASVPAAGHLMWALNKIAKDGNFDIIHDHSVSLGPLALRWATELPAMPPALHTMHWPFSSNNPALPDCTPLWEGLTEVKRVFVNGISNYQTSQAPKALHSHALPFIHNGLNVERMPFQTNKQSYFLTLARIDASKGITTAATLCADAHLPLKIAGPVAELTDAGTVLRAAQQATSTYENLESFSYFKNELWPILQRHKSIEYLGNVSGNDKKHLIAQAKALLFPIQWDEPFGLAVVEALSCGTPVIAMNRGAMPELIKHGKTGFLANDEKEFQYYMQQIGDIDPVACRKAAEQHFSSSIMAQRYLELYKTILKRDARLRNKALNSFTAKFK